MSNYSGITEINSPPPPPPESALLNFEHSARSLMASLRTASAELLAAINESPRDSNAGLLFAYRVGERVLVDERTMAPGELQMYRGRLGRPVLRRYRHRGENYYLLLGSGSPNQVVAEDELLSVAEYRELLDGDFESWSPDRGRRVIRRALNQRFLDRERRRRRTQSH